MFGSSLEQQILTLSRRRIHAQPQNILGTPLSPCLLLSSLYPLIEKSVNQCSVTQLYLTLWDPLDCSPLGSCPQDFPHKNTGVGCHFLLQAIFQTQGSPASLVAPALQADSLPLRHWLPFKCTTSSKFLCCDLLRVGSGLPEGFSQCSCSTLSFRLSLYTWPSVSLNS